MTVFDAPRRAPADALVPPVSPVAAPAAHTASAAPPAHGAPCPPRFAVAEGAADEFALERCWRRFADPGLDALVDATLQQGFAMSAAGLRLRRHAERPAGRATVDGDAADWVALAAFFAVRVREVADTCRAWAHALTLHERLALADRAMALTTAGQREARAWPDGDTTAGDPSPVAELHAHRLRLIARLDTVRIALAQRTGLPLARVEALLGERLLPAACAAAPGAGTPAALLRRRPDLIALRHRIALSPASRRDERALAYEEACARACADVDAAFAALRGLCAELVPVRAAACAAEVAANAARGRLREMARGAGAPPRAPTEAIDRLLRAEQHALACNDREIALRGAGFLALIDALEALGAGWPAAMALEDA